MKILIKSIIKHEARLTFAVTQKRHLCIKEWIANNTSYKAQICDKKG